MKVKIDLIGMIMNGSATPENLSGLLFRDDGSTVDDPAEVLDELFREYAKAVTEGKSNLVYAPDRFMPEWTKHGEFCPKRIASSGDCNCKARGK